MTVTFYWPAEVVDGITQAAKDRGLSRNDYLLQAVLQQDVLSTAPPDDAERSKRAEARRRILAIQERVQPDPGGWTSRDYINYGLR